MLFVQVLVVTQCILRTLHAVDINRFFAFNTGSSDEHKLQPNDDLYVEVMVNGNIRIPYFNQQFSKIWVSTNGVLSFNHGVGQYTPEPFPLADHLFLAAFWADVDIRCSACGNVYYHQSTQATELAQATRDVVEVYPLLQSQFNAKLLFIATWDHVGYYNHNSDKTNTFQTVIVTDGVRAFAIFNYLKQGIQWTFGAASVGKHAQAGFNKGDGATFQSVDGSFSDDILNVWRTSNIGVPGRWIFKIDEVNIEPPEQPAVHDEDYDSATETRVICTERFKVYDVIFNANGQLIHDIAKDGLISFINDEQLVNKMESKKGGKVCAVGPFKVGKTWLLKQLCGKSIPDDQVLKTRGVSVIFSSSQFADLFACVDTEGEHRVDEYVLGKARKATDKIHQEVALSICDVVFIVIDGLTSYKRAYVDDMLKRVAALSSALQNKEVYVVHNFMNFNDPKIVHSYIEDTILLAYRGEDVERIGGDGITSWAYYRHFWADDHQPAKKKQNEKLAVNHFIFAKANDTEGSAGHLWNGITMKRLRRFVEDAGTQASPLDIKQQVTEAFSKLLPKYYLATSAISACTDEQCAADAQAKELVYSGEDVFNVLDPSTWLHWFTWRPRVGESAEGYERQFDSVGDLKQSPYKAELQQDKLKTYRLILANREAYDFHPYNLTNDGAPLDGYSLSCHTAEYQKSLIIRCDVPGMELVGPKDVLTMGTMQITRERINRIGTIVIKGIRAGHSDMKDAKFTNTEKAFSGPFRYDFETPDGFDDELIKSEQSQFVTYANGELRIEIPAEA